MLRAKAKGTTTLDSGEKPVIRKIKANGFQR
jgi:hypothetical protein